MVSIRTALTVVDPLAVAVSGVAVLGVRNVPALLLAALAAVVICRGADLHRSRLVLSVVDDLPRLGVASIVSILVLAGLAPYLGESSATALDVVLAAVTCFVLVLALRGLVYSAVNAARRRGLVAHPVIVVGAGPVGRRVTQALLNKPEYGLTPLGIIDADDSTDAPMPVPLLGDLGGLEMALINLEVSDVIFAFAGPPDDTITAAVRRCVEADRQVFVVPRFFELMSGDHHRRTEVVHDVALMRLRRWGWNPAQVLLKRSLDVFVSAAALFVALPVLAVVGVALRRETHAPLIFRQTRVGKGGSTFTLLKFQTMRPATDEESATAWNIDLDDRLGPVGKFLRRTGIDELPQLWNVLRGDMSLVGPRPERPHFVETFSQIEANYADRHRVRAGITGWAQVNDLRGDTSISERVRFDNRYIETWSLWGDLKIMWKTVPTFGRSEPAGKDIISSISAAPREGEGTSAPASLPS